MFKKTNEFKQIKKKLEAINALYEFAIFECYMDSIITFGFIHESTYHQFNVISEDSFSREIMIEDLLDMKGITYFNHSAWMQSKYESDIELYSTTWSMFEHSGLN
jgi:hypothetical protein